jgi:probable F420-dependent oxidoreductase
MPDGRARMKVRIGYGIGTQGLADGGARFAELIDALEALGFDSIWCSERATGPIPEPMVSLAFAAGRTKKLKLGTSVQVLPGRNPVLLAKQWSSLDVLSGGRALPAFGLGVVEPHEQQAFGVTRKERAPWFEEALPLLRRLWSEDTVDHDGARFHYEGVSIGTRPVQQPLDVWLGGRAPRELRRVGELADGWLPSFCTPQQVADGRVMVEAAADAVGREIDDEHFGAMVFYARTEIPEPYASGVGARLGFDPSEVIAIGIPALRDRLEAFLDVGFSKLVLVPVQEAQGEGTGAWRAEVEELATSLLDLQGTRPFTR